ncbi:hypothetical protein EON62_00380 [archaeon]|nr:MAG: hypothetical protein EON62_00380 [archaeon]
MGRAPPAPRKNMVPRMASCKRDRTRAAAVWMVALALLLCCRVTPAASADFYTTASYPDLDVRVKQLVDDATAPPVDATQGECFVDERCGHGHGAFTRLCDPDHVLSYPGALRVSATLNLIETNITMSCGSAGQQPYQVAVALMNRAHIGYSEEASDVIPRLTRALHDKWGVGHAACNNGIVLGLSVQDRYVRARVATCFVCMLALGQASRARSSSSPAHAGIHQHGRGRAPRGAEHRRRAHHYPCQAAAARRPPGRRRVPDRD